MAKGNITIDVLKELTTEMIEIIEIDHGVDVLVSADQDKLWLNVDGICRVRIQGIKGRLQFDIPKPDPIVAIGHGVDRHPEKGDK